MEQNRTILWRLFRWWRWLTRPWQCSIRQPSYHRSSAAAHLWDLGYLLLRSRSPVEVPKEEAVARFLARARHYQGLVDHPSWGQFESDLQEVYRQAMASLAETHLGATETAEHFAYRIIQRQEGIAALKAIPEMVYGVIRAANEEEGGKK